MTRQQPQKRIGIPGVLGGAATGMGTLLMLGWLGLRVQPRPFPPYPAQLPTLDTMPLPDGLPAPVARYYAAAFDGAVPRVQSAVITGQGSVHLGALSLPTRLRFTLDATRGYRHYLESTWAGLPILKVNETYLEGQARMEMPWGTVAGEPKVDRAARLNFWGEAVSWMPSFPLIGGAAVRWEAVNDRTARLLAASSDGPDALTVTFNAQTGLVSRMDTLRYRSAADREPLPWRFEPLGWRRFNGVLTPTPFAVTWMDQETPWLVVSVHDVAFNVDISEYIATTGL